NAFQLFHSFFNSECRTMLNTISLRIPTERESYGDPFRLFPCARREDCLPRRSQAKAGGQRLRAYADFCTKNLTLPSPWKGEAAYCDLAPHKGVPKLGSPEILNGKIRVSSKSYPIRSRLSTTGARGRRAFSSFAV